MRRRLSLSFSFAAALLALLLAPATAFGQGATTASIQGTVTDAAGELLPGANVMAVHVPSGTRYGASTGENGQYNLANLRAGGPYRITVSFVGYQSKREEGLALDLGQTLRLDFQLQEQTAQLEEIEVVAQRGGILSSERTGVAANISSQELESQPTMGQQIADVARLVPQAYVQNSDDDGASISIAGQYNRFNAIYIDGAVSNDVFGLAAQGTDGGQSGASPISLNAVEQVSVDVSPFDVTKSGFVGGAINFVTKSGTNDWEGSFKYLRRGSSLTQSQFAPEGETLVDGLPSAPNNRYVASLGGPIVKNKLFFFANLDVRRSEDALPYQPYDGALGFEGTDNDQQLDGLGEIRNFVERNTGYDPGTPRDKATILDSDKYLLRLDYNVSSNHRLTARYFYNDHYNVDGFQSTTEFANFQNNSEVFPSRQHNAMLQWNGSFGNRVATQTTATFKNNVDDRGVEEEPFPSITVEDPGGGFSLGSEPFSYPNYLEQTVGTFTNETDVFLGDHTLTVGTHNEFYAIDNRFAIFGPGNYSFDNVGDFAETVCHYAQQNQGQYGIEGPGRICQEQYADPQPQTSFYLRQYSLLDDDPSTPAFESDASDDTNLRSEFNAVKLGLFAQDEWAVTDRLRLTFGLRADLPKILDDPRAHPTANSETLPSIQDAGYDLEGARVGEMPDWQVFWAPRAGANFALNEERTAQLRGGAGVYTSRLPFVWPGGAYLNDGMSADFLAGGDFGFLPGQTPPLRRPENGLTRPGGNYKFFGGSDVPVEEIRPTGNLIIFAENFSYPRVLRTSLAYDQELPFGLIGTLEGQYSSQLQTMVVQNVNLKKSNETLDGPDGRPIWVPSQYEDETITVDDRYGEVLLVKNRGEGYSYNLTGRLQKEPFQVTDGGTVRASASYTYGDSRSLNDYGDTVGSNWDDNEHVQGTNNLNLGRSDYSLGHRIQAKMAYRQEFTDNIASNLSLYYSGTSGRPFSYTIGGGANDEMVGDQGGAPLFYVPEDVSNLELAPITDQDGNVLRTPGEQRADLRRFINNTESLSDSRGDYVTRNGDRTPFEGVVDLQFSVDFSGELVGQSQRLSVSANVFNFSSLLGDLFGTDWGHRYQIPQSPAGSGTYSPVSFSRFENPEAGNYTPVYQSNLGTAEGDITRSKEDFFEYVTTGTTYSSLYQIQLSMEYTF